MVFSSHLFLFYFLPVFLGIYFALPKRGKNVSLLLTSYVFYGWANPYFVLLMLLSTVIDYGCGLVIGRNMGEGGSMERKRRIGISRVAVVVSVCSNLSLLAFFKYFNFGIENYNELLTFLGLGDMRWDTVLRITLPLGISFYTFQSMSYSIDVFRGDAKPVHNFIDFACYVAMFPQLVAGPIVRFREVAKQITGRTHTVEKFARGVTFFCCGMAKKVLLANPCGKVADVCFDSGSLSVLDAWYGLFAYAFQIYFDFSGYSDMAIGLGLMIGFVFPKNFDSPYLSRSITELWRRWHLSLSFFLRDYLYVALGGNRKGIGRTYFNLAVVMLLGGLWHGASWNFIIWGGIHGSMLAFERMQGKDSVYRNLPDPLRIFLTFLITCLAWVFFRSPDLISSFDYLSSLFGIASVDSGAGLVAGIIYQPYYVLIISIACFITWTIPQTWEFTRRITWVRVGWIFAIFALSIGALFTQSYNPFIYFIF